MKLINCNKIALLLSFFLLVGCSATETNARNNYSDLNFIDLVRNKEDSIHTQRVNTLNSKISNREEDIKSYQKKIRLTKQAINNVKIEVSSYNSIINNVTDNISNINQLNSVLSQFEQQIRNVEIEFDRVKRVSAGLEKITKSEFLELKQKGYFNKIATWSDYVGIVSNAIEAKKEMERYVNSSKKGIAYVKANKGRIIKRIAKKGAIKLIGHFIPYLLPLAILDDLKDIYDYMNA